MENATKALLIAAGVLIAIMVLSLLLISYNQISSYYNEKHLATETEQLAEFNKVYENYHRNNIRGSDLISLMNRIIDYNERQSYADGTNYKRIAVTITIGEELLNQLKYETSGKRNELIQSVITNVKGASRIEDDKLIEVAGTEAKLIAEAEEAGIPDLTSAKLQKLSSNISNIMINEDSTLEAAEKEREKRKKLLVSILGVDISSDSAKITKIKEITSQYYQYTQFKRAYFNCTEVNYDELTGRVCEMKFEICTKDNMIVFN